MATGPYSDTVHVSREGAKGLAAHATEALKPELAKIDLADTLYSMIGGIGPTRGTEWEDLTDDQQSFYIAVVSKLLADKHLVAAAIGASFMVPVPVLED